MKDIRIDRVRALKAAATAGLAVLAISILPGLLSPPAPPPLAPDVGFKPVEIRTTPAVQPRSGSAGDTAATRRRQAPPAGSESMVRDRTRPRPGRSTRPAGPHTPGSAQPVGTPPPVSASTPTPVPISAPTPSPSPAPPPAPASPAPADGSQEFAPR